VKQPGTEELKAIRQVQLEDGGRYRIFDLPPGQYAVGLWWGGLPVGSGAQMYPDKRTRASSMWRAGKIIAASISW